MYHIFGSVFPLAPPRAFRASRLIALAVHNQRLGLGTLASGGTFLDVVVVLIVHEASGTIYDVVPNPTPRFSMQALP
jgi:hypothetical protein